VTFQCRHSDVLRPISDVSVTFQKCKTSLEGAHVDPRTGQNGPNSDVSDGFSRTFSSPGDFEERGEKG